jgi:hypothetical protein
MEPMPSLAKFNNFVELVKIHRYMFNMCIEYRAVCVTAVTHTARHTVHTTA